MNFTVATLNLGGRAFPSDDAIGDFLDLNSAPAFLCVALQEAPIESLDAITKYLSTLGYVMLTHDSININRNILFVEQQAVERVSNVIVLNVATLNGGIGSRNKGGVMIRFQFDHFKVAFVGCHLAAHRKYVQERNADATEIIDMITRSETDHGDLDFVCVYGDLNYRLSFFDDSILLALKTVSDNEVTERELTKQADHTPLEWTTVHDQYLENQNFRGLSQHCQLRQILSNNALPWAGFQEFQDGIDFPPTFKWVPNSSFEPLRLPAFCDRIVFKHAGKSSFEVIQHTYDSPRKVTFSDHRPVVATFSLLVSPSQ